MSRVTGNSEFQRDKTFLQCKVNIKYIFSDPLILLMTREIKWIADNKSICPKSSKVTWIILNEIL